MNCEKFMCPVYQFYTATLVTVEYRDPLIETIQRLKQLTDQLNDVVTKFNNHYHNNINGENDVNKVTANWFNVVTSSTAQDMSSVDIYKDKNIIYKKNYNNEVKAFMKVKNLTIPLECLACSNFQKIDIESEFLVGDAIKALSGQL